MSLPVPLANGGALISPGAGHPQRERKRNEGRMPRRNSSNGRLEEAIATLISNQSSFQAKFMALSARTDERFARIENELAEIQSNSAATRSDSPITTGGHPAENRVRGQAVSAGPTPCREREQPLKQPPKRDRLP